RDYHNARDDRDGNTEVNGSTLDLESCKAIGRRAGGEPKRAEPDSTPSEIEMLVWARETDDAGLYREDAEWIRRGPECEAQGLGDREDVQPIGNARAVFKWSKRLCDLHARGPCWRGAAARFERA